EKLFVFNVTMQNHGGYDIDNGSLEENIYALNGNNRVANCYLSLINESDNALKYLIDYFSKEDENTMIVFFGDHLPALSDSAYQDLMGQSLEVLKKDIEMYQTPFFIWTNYNLEVRNIDYISSNYLGSIILDEANLPLPVYQQYLLNLYEAIPVIGYQGCFDYEGNFYSYNDLPFELRKLLDQYECMQYNHIKY
ncbi:sulfatase-like hydrolase/transferase, partial [Clostridium sp. MCC353]|uniref:sulfatase-like hydrolase/transferase n=1 Tax=Clostridium sp. MCC353 TaxID=2592646 RepID=UPI001C02D7DA